MDCLPHEVLCEIFQKLPIKSLMACKSVSRDWNKLICEPKFLHDYEINPPYKSILIPTYHSQPDNSRQHLQYNLVEIPADGNCVRSSFVRTSFVVSPPVGHSRPWLVCSCNGLICLRYTLHDEVYIMNFLMGECVKLPNPRFDDHEGHPCLVDYVLGFSPRTNSFKVLRTVYKLLDDQTLVAEHKIVTVGEDSGWRQLPLTSCFSQPHPYLRGGVSMNGVFHWIKGEELVTFEVEGEKAGPNICPPDRVDLKSMDLSVVNDRLCLTNKSGDFGDAVIWTMQEYGVKESWRRYVVSREWFPDSLRRRALIPVEILRDGSIIFSSIPQCILVSCDIERKRCTVIGTGVADRVGFFSALPFTPKLLSMNKLRKVEPEVLSKL